MKLRDFKVLVLLSALASAAGCAHMEPVAPHRMKVTPAARKDGTHTLELGSGNSLWMDTTNAVVASAVNVDGTASNAVIGSGGGTVSTSAPVSGDGVGSPITIAAGAITGTSIAASAVTLAMQANFAASSLMGNPTGSPAAPSAITLGSGLAFSGTTLTATLSTGLSGGQTVIGGTVSGNALTLTSNTSNNGVINIGAPNLQTGGIYFEATGQMGVGTRSNGSMAANFILDVYGSGNLGTYELMSNDSNGTASVSGYIAGDAKDAFGHYVAMIKYSPSYTASNLLGPQVGQIDQQSSNGAALIIGNGGTGDVVIYTTSSQTPRLRFLNAGLLKYGAASTVANGSQVLTVGATGPSGIGTTTPFEYMTAQDNSGNQIWWAVYH